MTQQLTERQQFLLAISESMAETAAQDAKNPPGTSPGVAAEVPRPSARSEAPSQGCAEARRGTAAQELETSTSTKVTWGLYPYKFTAGLQPGTASKRPPSCCGVGVRGHVPFLQRLKKRLFLRLQALPLYTFFCLVVSAP